VDIEYFRPTSATASEGERALIYTGGMNMFANRDAVLFFMREIWPHIKLGMPNATFYAVGQDPPPELLRIAKADPGIVVTGYVNDIRPFVARSSVYVVPLRVGGGTRLKVVDAMAMGKAIVSTHIGAEGIHVKSGENVLLVDEPREFAERTLRLLRDRSLRDRLGAAARRLAEDVYSWDKVGSKLQAIYESLVAMPRQSRKAVVPTPLARPRPIPVRPTD
jgi:glycosyltransferase involved in cell wall biosynthesis